MRRDRPAREAGGVDADVGADRRRPLLENPWRGHEAALGTLGVDARLDRVAAQHDIVLAERQGFAAGDAQLLAHDVDAGDRLADRVLDLQPGVDLEESIRRALRVDEKLARRRSLVVE